MYDSAVARLLAQMCNCLIFFNVFEIFSLLRKQLIHTWDFRWSLHFF